MTEIVLPPKYYLHHFEEFIREVKRLHGHLIEPSHSQYLADFETLDENARCLLIRMINRTGRIFDMKDLIYEEISDYEKSWATLHLQKFIRFLQSDDREDYFQWLKKDELKKILSENGVAFKKSASRDELLSKVKDLDFEIADLKSIVVLHRHEDIRYLLFLYFGKLQNKLILPTLRDLGIRKSNKSQTLVPKFESKEEARAQYFYADLKERFRKISAVITPEDITQWPESERIECLAIREDILLKIYLQYRDQQNLPRALEILSFCRDFPGSSHRVRLLHQLGHESECLKELERMMDDPLNDEELIFAEDFLERKFYKKRLSVLTQTLREAKKIQIDESFYRHPEIGVLDYYKSQGTPGFFAENRLWTTLFWTLFSEELEKSSHSEFDQVPPELLEKTFLKTHGASISQKLNLLKKDELLEIFVDDPMISAFVEHGDLQWIKSTMVYMAEDYYSRCTGWPDVFIIENGFPAFIEIKAEGDSLKPSQIKQMRFLEKLGISVKVLQVGYLYNPEQTYVVVDLETTGTLSSWNRITEIGAVKIKNNTVIDRFQTLVNPKRSIPQDIQVLTGITNSMVANAPEFKDVSEAFLKFTEGSIFVAHNASFDYGFLQQEFNRLEQRFVMPYICTKAWMRKYYPGLESYGLKKLTLKFGVVLENHHRALDDAQAAAGLLKLINEKRATKGLV